MKNKRYLLILTLIIIILNFSCSKGPGEPWVKNEVRGKFSTYWVYGDRHAEEGKDYAFGKYEIAENGKEGRITVIIHSKLFRSKGRMHSSIPAPRWFSGTHKIEFWKDEYGEWRMGEM